MNTDTDRTAPRYSMSSDSHAPETSNRGHSATTNARCHTLSVCHDRQWVTVAAGQAFAGLQPSPSALAWLSRVVRMVGSRRSRMARDHSWGLSTGDTARSAAWRRCVSNRISVPRASTATRVRSVLLMRRSRRRPPLMVTVTSVSCRVVSAPASFSRCS